MIHKCITPCAGVIDPNIHTIFLTLLLLTNSFSFTLLHNTIKKTKTKTSPQNSLLLRVVDVAVVAVVVVVVAGTQNVVM